MSLLEAAEMLVDRPPDIVEIINRRLVAMVTARAGYSFDAERINRIASAMRVLVESGLHAVDAFAGAFEVDLLLYGDPKTPDEHARFLFGLPSDAPTIKAAGFNFRIADWMPPGQMAGVTACNCPDKSEENHFIKRHVVIIKNLKVD